MDQVIMYVRKPARKGGRPVGALVAVKDGDKYQVGYSLCHKNDKFDKKLSVSIAAGRARRIEEVYNKTNALNGYNVPRAVKEVLPFFKKRCDKFFKGLKAPTWIGLFVKDKGTAPTVDLSGLPSLPAYPPLVNSF